VSVISSVIDFRKNKGKQIPLPLMLFCLLLTELKNCHRQRHRVRWLDGNWDWITEVWFQMTGHVAPPKAFSQATLSRLLQRVDIWGLKEQYLAEIRRIQKELSDSNEVKSNIQSKKKILRHISFDGKSRKGIVSVKTGRTEIDLAFYDVSSHQVIATDTLYDKEGEATKALAMMKRLGRTLTTSIFTGDAGFASPALLSGIISAGHEYIIGLKSNAGDVYEIAKNLNWEEIVESETTDDDKHGRQEVRTIKRIYILKSLEQYFEKYKNYYCLYRIESKRIIKGVVTLDVRYFIGSNGLKGYTLKEIMKIIRAHWKQENCLHWVKDKVLGEDGSYHMTNRSSRVLGFFKNIVVSIGYSVLKSVQNFVDAFDARPKKFTRKLCQLE
jgi:hypothetical protein